MQLGLLGKKGEQFDLGYYESRVSKLREAMVKALAEPLREVWILMNTEPGRGLASGCSGRDY